MHKSSNWFTVITTDNSEQTTMYCSFSNNTFNLKSVLNFFPLRYRDNHNLKHTRKIQTFGRVKNSHSLLIAHKTSLWFLVLGKSTLLTKIVLTSTKSQAKETYRYIFISTVHVLKCFSNIWNYYFLLNELLHLSKSPKFALNFITCFLKILSRKVKKIKTNDPSNSIL